MNTRHVAPDEQVTIWFDEHAESLFRFLAGAYDSECDAEAITQAAFLRLHEALQQGVLVESPRVWTFSVARPLMQERQRRRRRARLLRLVWAGVVTCLVLVSGAVRAF